jgi:hypothetical protein
MNNAICTLAKPDMHNVMPQKAPTNAFRIKQTPFRSGYSLRTNRPLFATSFIPHAYIQISNLWFNARLGQWLSRLFHKLSNCANRGGHEFDPHTEQHVIFAIFICVLESSFLLGTSLSAHSGPDDSCLVKFEEFVG